VSCVPLGRTEGDIESRLLAAGVRPRAVRILKPKNRGGGNRSRTQVTVLLELSEEDGTRDVNEHGVPRALATLAEMIPGVVIEPERAERAHQPGVLPGGAAAAAAAVGGGGFRRDYQPQQPRGGRGGGGGGAATNTAAAAPASMLTGLSQDDVARMFG
jgi:hypothetical protein